MILISHNGVGYINDGINEIIPYIKEGITNDDPKNSKSFLEMGFFDTFTKKQYPMPIQLKYVKILSLEVDHSVYPCSNEFVAEVNIHSADCKTNMFHTFHVKNGVYFFVNSIIKTLNDLIDKGYLFEDINFEFLDNECNHKQYNHHIFDLIGSYSFSISNYDYIIKYYKIVTVMELIVFNNSANYKDGHYEWKEVEITINTNDKYIISIFDDILKSDWDISKICLCTENEKTKFSIIEKDHWTDNTWWHCEKKIADENIQKKYKENYTNRLIGKGMKLIVNKDVIEFFSTKKMK